MNSLTKSPGARHFCVLLFAVIAATWLTGCASDPEPLPITSDVEVVADPQPVYRSLDRQYTSELPYPPGLPENFTVLDTLDLIYHLYDTVDIANADRVCAGRLVNGEECDDGN